MEDCMVGLIVIGDEILRGQIIDTNTSYLAKNLRAVGLKLCRVTVVPDNVDEIAEIVSQASLRYPIVFTSGGVGPTHDDVTYKSVAKGLELELELNEELLNFYTKQLPGEKEIERLAVVPKPCEIIYVHSAETYAVIKTKNVYILPGSPKYFQSAADTILSRLKGNSPLHIEYVDVDSNEFSMVKILDRQAERWKNKVKIGSYPQTQPKCFTQISLEGNKLDVMKAKEELLSSFASQANEDDKFTLDKARNVIKDGKNQPHVKDALDILEQCFDKYKPNEIFLSFNGGKDCTVVLHLTATITKLRNISPLLCLYVTGDSFPEVDLFVNQAAYYYGAKIVKKQRPMISALKELLNENRDLKTGVMGMRKADPGSENLQAFSMTDSGWPELMRVNPIINWNYQQVWKFLLEHKVPYCSLYDQGYTSIGTKTTTVPNPALRDPKDPTSYLPAYTLDNDSAERQGRE